MSTSLGLTLFKVHGHSSIIITAGNTISIGLEELHADIIIQCLASCLFLILFISSPRTYLRHSGMRGLETHIVLIYIELRTLMKLMLGILKLQKSVSNMEKKD